MNNKTKKLLFDMLTSINNIESYIGEEKIFEDYTCIMQGIIIDIVKS